LEFWAKWVNEQAPTFLAYDERQVSVVDEDSLAGLDDLNEVLVVEPEQVLRTRLLMLVVYGDGYRVASLDLRLSVHTLGDKRQQQNDLDRNHDLES